ncbi:ribonuclease H-like domain-containing protein [Tanacetum coccineum]
MNQEEIQQAARGQALVPTDDRIKIGSSNMKIDPTNTQKEDTYQVILDTLKLSLCYNAFLITADVPEIYFPQRALGKPLQPWRTFATIINKCLSGKTSGNDRLRQSRAKILWGLFYKKNVDFAELIWEDLQYQNDYRQSNVRRCEIMPYPRFTKVIIYYFLSKHNSISKRQGSHINTIKDDGVLGRFKFINKGEPTQVYGMSIPDVMLNDEIKNFKAYQTHLALSTCWELNSLSLNGNPFKLAAKTTTNADGTSTTLIPGPVTTKEKVQKKNDMKARSMLLMALLNEHLMTFNQYKDAKTLFAAIQTRFAGNEATRKTQKTLLKQMYENFSAPSTESLDSILTSFRRLNKPDLDTMSFDDLYNNFNIVEQEVKGTASSSSSSSSQNMAFVSSPSSTNEVNTAYGVSTANTQVSPASTQVSPASTQVSTASTQVSTANLSDDTVYAFLASQPNGSQLVYEDLEQIHEDDIEEMDLKWQLALLSMRTRRFFQKTGRKITINGSDTTGYDKSKVECFNCHKMGHFARECRGPRNQDNRNRNQDSSRRTVNVEEISSKAMLAIDGAGFDWSYMADDEVPTNMALMAFSDSEEFQHPEFKGYGPKTSKNVYEDTSNKFRESPNALMVEKLVSDD